MSDDKEFNSSEDEKSESSEANEGAEESQDSPENKEASGNQEASENQEAEPAGSEPEGTMVSGKSNAEDANEDDAEAAMLAMMEGSEVGDSDSSFEEKLAGLPEAEKPSPDSIAFDQPVVRDADLQQLSGKTEREEPRSIDMLLDVHLPISIELGRTQMTISDILALGPGSVVELSKLAGEPVEVQVNQKTVALGEVVVVDENFGVRITQLMSPEERLKTLKH